MSNSKEVESAKQSMMVVPSNVRAALMAHNSPNLGSLMMVPSQSGTSNYATMLQGHMNTQLARDRSLGASDGLIVQINLRPYSSPVKIKVNWEEYLDKIPFKVAIKNLLINPSINQYLLTIIRSVFRSATIAAKNIPPSHICPEGDRTKDGPNDGYACPTCAFKVFDIDTLDNQYKELFDRHDKVMPFMHTLLSRICYGLITYGKCWSLKRIDFTSENVMYVPVHMMAALLANKVAQLGNYPLDLSKNIRMKSSNPSRIQFEANIMLLYLMHTTKLLSATIANIHIDGAGACVNFPCVFNLHVGPGAKGFAAFLKVPDIILYRYKEIGGVLHDKISCLKVTITGIEPRNLQNLYNQITSYLVGYFSKAIKVKEFAEFERLGNLINNPYVSEFLQVGSFKVLGTNTAVSLVRVLPSDRNSKNKTWDKYYKMGSQTDSDIACLRNLCTLFNPFLLYKMGGVVAKYLESTEERMPEIVAVTWRVEYGSSCYVMHIPTVKLSQKFDDEEDGRITTIDFEIDDSTGMMNMPNWSWAEEVMSHEEKNSNHNLYQQIEDVLAYSGMGSVNYLDHILAMSKVSKDINRCDSRNSSIDFEKHDFPALSVSSGSDTRDGEGSRTSRNTISSVIKEGVKPKTSINLGEIKMTRKDRKRDKYTTMKSKT